MTRLVRAMMGHTLDKWPGQRGPKDYTTWNGLNAASYIMWNTAKERAENLSADRDLLQPVRHCQRPARHRPDFIHR